MRAGSNNAEHLKTLKAKHPQVLLAPSILSFPLDSRLLLSLLSHCALQAETVLFDYDDLASCAAALRGVSRVFHITTYTVSMLEHSKLFVDAAKEAGVHHMVVSVPHPHNPQDTLFHPSPLHVMGARSRCSIWGWTCPAISR